jgi:hypothetical protein
VGARLTLRTAALLGLPALALLLLAAHLLHAGWLPLAAVSVLSIGLLALRQPWAARTLQFVLVLATIEWVRTTVGLAQVRLHHGEPYLRLVLILGAVTLYTALAAAAFQHPALRRYFAGPTAGQAPT